MIRVEKIFFDMDGVLADFDRGVKEMCGIEPPSQPGGRRSQEEDDLMWERMKHVDHFYDKLQPVDGAVSMFFKIYGEFGDKCEILTGIPRPHRGIDNAAEDKVRWVNRILTCSDNIRVNTVYRSEKVRYCKGERYILIDDLEQNIADWENEGGTGILHRNAADTLIRLSSMTGISFG